LVAAAAVFSIKPSQPGLGRGSTGTDVLKLHNGLRKAGSSLAMQLITGTNDLDVFLF
jgi:hypothetical protein